MSFIIKCSGCGNEVHLTSGDSMTGDKIQIIPDVVSNWNNLSYKVLGVDIYCDNPICQKEVHLSEEGNGIHSY